MPQVPGDLTPTQRPSDQGTPELNISVTPDAFGASIGHALQGVGSDLSQAGDRIWQRAVEIQNLNNEAEVDRADAKYMERAGILHAEFSAKQGVEAQQAFPKYIQDLKDARTDISGGMTNPMSQKMFDKTSLSTMGRTIFNGAGHAATQTRMAAIDGVTQRLNSTVDKAATSEDPAEIEELRGKAQGLNYKLHQLKGQPDSVDDGERIINSSIDSNRVYNLAKTDPFKAKEMLDAKKGQITEQDYNRVDNFITSQRRAIGSANIANEVWAQGRGDGDKPELSESDMVAIGKKQANETAPDDPIFAQHVENAIHAKYTREKQSERQATWDAKQEIAVAMQNGATTLQELQANPKTAAAIQQLPPREQNAIPAQLNRYVKARDYADNQRNMTVLDGLRKNDVLSFLDIDPTDAKYKLSQSQIRTVMGWQAELKKNQNQDPQVNRAMSWIRGSMGSQLQALGIYHRNGKEPDDYDHFTGALSEAISEWTSAKGKPPDSKDVTETIAPQLLKTHQELGWLWGTNTSAPEFKDALSTDKYKAFAKRHAQDRLDQGLPEPSSQETERLFYRGLARELYQPRDPTKQPM
jgi:hypothetical protein